MGVFPWRVYFVGCVTRCAHPGVQGQLLRGGAETQWRGRLGGWTRGGGHPHPTPNPKSHLLTHAWGYNTSVGPLRAMRVPGHKGKPQRAGVLDVKYLDGHPDLA